MNKIKIQKIVSVFCDCIGITGNYRETLEELMIKIISKYETINVGLIADKQQYIMKADDDKYTVEDFFLNRLLYNVTTLELTNSGGRADYNPGTRTVRINRDKLIKILDRYNKYSFSNEKKDLAIKKVVMHEFEHALQTKFEYGPNINSVQHYKEIYSRLNKLNIDIKLNDLYNGGSTINYLSAGNYIQSGLHYPSDKDVYRKYQGTFYLNENDKNFSAEDNINEIFNESESLVMSGSNENIPIFFPSGNIINVRNVESSNYLITNYGFMIKQLLSDEIVFKGMYLNRNYVIDMFNNEYSQILYQIYVEHFEKVYPNMDIKDGWTILTMAINEAKYSYESANIDHKKYSELCHQKLNLALSLCFEHKIKREIALGLDYEECKKKWSEFVSLALYNNDIQKHNELPHAKILFNLREYIKNSYSNEIFLTSQSKK